MIKLGQAIQSLFIQLPKRISLTKKMLFTTLFVGVAVWALMDFFIGRSLETVFKNELEKQLAKESELDRNDFDWYVQAHRHAIQIFLSNRRFIDYLEQADWEEEQTARIKHYNTIPPWLPPASILRAMVHVRYALLIDPDGKVREIYQDWPVHLPESLMKPTWILQQLSHNQTFMTTVEDIPFLISADTLEDINGITRAALMIANPIDDYLLIASQKERDTEGSIVALMAGDELQVIASSGPEKIPYGAKLTDLQENFFVTGKSFFDYGSSDLMMQFTSLISKEYFKTAAKSILHKARIHRAVMTVSIIIISLVIIFKITQKINRLTMNILEFSRDLEIQPLAITKGDELQTLVEHYQHLQHELVKSRKALKKETETQRKLYHAIEQTPVPIVITDNTGVIEYINPKFLETAGFADHEVLVLGQKPNLLKSDFISQEFYKHMWGSIISGQQWKGEIKNKKKNGKYYWESAMISPVKNKEGQITHFIGIKEDITARKEAEEKLRFQAQLLDSVQEAVIATDIDGHFIYWGKGAQSLYGYQASEVIGKSILSIVSDLSDNEISLDNIFNGYTWLGKYLQRRKDGSLFWADTDASPVIDETGKSCGMIGITRDITQRIHMEEELRKRKERLDEAQRIAHIGDWELDIVSNKLLCSEEVYHIFNLSLHDSFENWNDYIKKVHIDDKQMVQYALNEAMFSNNPFNITHRIYLTDGKERIVHVKGKVVFSEKRIPVRIIGTIHDITELKKAEEELKKHKNRLEEIVQERTRELREKEGFLCSLIDTAGSAIVFLTPDFIINKFNKEAERLYNFSAKEVIGKRYCELFPENHQEAVCTLLNNVLEGTPIRNYESPVISHNSIQQILLWNADRVVDIQQRTVGIIAIGQNITKRKQYEEKLKASVKEKEILLQEIHHRVKNNLQVISSLIGLQMASIKDKNYKDMFKESQNRIKSMALVHEKLYRTEGLENIDFHDYIVKLSYDLMASYGLYGGSVSLNVNMDNISLNLDTAIPCGLIINELLSNSLKHAFPEKRYGEILIKLIRSNTNEMQLLVRDNGVGIPEEIDFRRTKSLGLNIVNTLVRQLKGTIELSRANGTEFCIQFKI